MALGTSTQHPSTFSRNMRGEPRLWSVILPRSESGQLFYARAVKTPMCAALRTFATDRVTYYFRQAKLTRRKDRHGYQAATRQCPRRLGSTITEAMDVIEGFVPCGHPALTVSNALVALDADDDAALAQQLETVEGFIDHVSENRGVAAYHGIEVELAGPKADLLAAIREVGTLMQTAGVKNTQVNEWVYRSLAALDSSDEKAAEQLAESPTIKAELL